MSILIFLLVLYVLNSITMMKLFEKAGIEPKKALIPGVAAVEWCKMVGRKPQYALWLLFPIVNLFIYVGLCIDMVRSFGKHSFWQSVVAAVVPPLPFYQIGKDPKYKYLGPVLEQEREYHRQYAEALEKKDDRSLTKLKSSPFSKSTSREWAEAIIFAVFAASFIRMFIFEAFVIPTSSMEGSLKVGDFLFVSKPTYGLRLPMTVLQVPLVHNRMPFGQKNSGFMARESYLNSPSLPYTRLPGWEKVERNKPVVFNFPCGDSVYVFPDRVTDIYQWRRDPEKKMLRAKLTATRPIDKKDHYIKRCVGVPGDSIMVRGSDLYVNGQMAYKPKHMQFMYKVFIPKGTSLNKDHLTDWDISDRLLQGLREGTSTTPSDIRIFFSMDDEQVNKLRSISGVTVERYKFEPSPQQSMFPNVPSISGNWSIDDYGAIYVPKAGATVALTPQSLPFYERIIRIYEKNDLQVRGGKYFINGQEATTYTFKQNYYWMMGDNRHESEDSRFWGYVPEDHIVGKPVLVWFSTKGGSIFKGVNLKRIFLRPDDM
jgi:signal peptidase I